jgi:hypothetical protein
MPHTCTHSDCGVHVCANAYCIAFGIPVASVQSGPGISWFRKHMALSIIDQKLRDNPGPPPRADVTGPVLRTHVVTQKDLDTTSFAGADLIDLDAA